MKIINIALVCCFAVCACDKQSSVDPSVSSDASSEVDVVVSSSQPAEVLSSSQSVVDAGVQDVLVKKQ